MRFFKNPVVPLITKPLLKIRRPWQNAYGLNSVLIVDNRQIGDSLMMLNVLKILRESGRLQIPRIGLISGNQIASLASQDLSISKVYPIQFPEKWLRADSLIKYIHCLRKVGFDQYDITLDVLGHELNHVLLRLAGCKNLVSDGQRGPLFSHRIIIPNPNPEHISKTIWNLFQKSFGYPIGKLESLRLECVRNYRQINQDIIVAPHARETIREMSDSFWLNVLKLIEQRGRNAIFVLDGRKNCSLETLLINRKIKVWKDSINELHKKFQNYRVFIGVDSMCGHLAAYAGVTNVITIYKNETHEYFEPLASNPIPIYGSKIIAENGIVRRGPFRVDAEILVEIDNALELI